MRQSCHREVRTYAKANLRSQGEASDCNYLVSFEDKISYRLQNSIVEGSSENAPEVIAMAAMGCELTWGSGAVGLGAVSSGARGCHGQPLRREPTFQDPSGPVTEHLIPCTGPEAVARLPGTTNSQMGRA